MKGAVLFSVAAAINGEECVTEQTSMIQVARMRSVVGSQRHLHIYHNKETDETCLPVVAGDKAPVAGKFTAEASSTRVDVNLGQIAPSAGTFCVDSTTFSLLQRSMSSLGLDADAVEASLVKKESMDGKQGNVEGSVQSKTAESQGPPPTGPCTDTIDGYDEIFENGNSGTCKTIRPAKTLHHGDCRTDYWIAGDGDSFGCPSDGLAIKQFANPQACAEVCSDNDKCKGVEWTPENGCKFWYTPPLLAAKTEGTAARCFIRNNVAQTSEIGAGRSFGSAREQMLSTGASLKMDPAPMRNPGEMIEGYEEVFMGGTHGLSGSCRFVGADTTLEMGVCCDGTEFKEDSSPDGIVSNLDDGSSCPASHNFLALNDFVTTKNRTCVETPEMIAQMFKASSPADCAKLCDSDPECHSFEMGLEDDGWGACELWRGPARPSFAENRPGKPLWCYRKKADAAALAAKAFCPTAE